MIHMKGISTLDCTLVGKMSIGVFLVIWVAFFNRLLISVQDQQFSFNTDCICNFGISFAMDLKAG